MEQEIIEKMNEAIAEFMGLQKSGNDFGTLWLVDDKKRVYGTVELKYHSDWSWIMPVYAKVRECYDKDFSRSKLVLLETVRNALIRADISELHEHLYVAILWYNSQVKETIKP